MGSLPVDLVAGLWSALQEPRIWFALGISLVGGVVRGYSGFGGALIVVPLIAMVFGPIVAVPMFYLIDLGSATPYGYKVLPQCKWTQILPMLAGHLAMLPIGAWMLSSLDSTALRWGMEGCVVAMLVLLMSGWRYTGRPNPGASVVVGASAGILGSAAGMAGPPIIAYWLGSATDILFLYRGLFTWQVLLYALLVWPAYALGLWGGAKVFHRSSEAAFRISAYILIAISAVLSMPPMDRFLK